MRIFSRLIIFLILAAIIVAPFAFAESEHEELTAKGYVLVTAGAESRWFAFPDEEDYSFTIRQTAPDGSEMNNTITITPDSVYMSDSDCEGHDCVDEGVVTLENKEERVLRNMIICLPHQISIELYSREEVIAMSERAPAR